MIHRIAIGVLVVFLGLTSSFAQSTKPATRPLAELSPEDRHRLVQLTRQAVDLLKRNQLEPAERTLAQALQINPTHYLNLYNMACVKAVLGKADEAIECLERAALAGYTDFIHIEKDPDLQSLRDLPRYRDFLAHKEDYQRRVADLTLAWLQRELGEGYLFEIDTQNKLIFATNTDAPTLEALKKRLLIQASSLWEELFEHRPEQYISIVLPSPVDYRQIVSRPGVGGFYNHEKRILIAQRLGQVMTHEFTHALHNADLDPLGQEHAPWVSEGLATLYEPAQLDHNTLIPADNFRLRAVQDAAKAKRLLPLRRLLEMDQKAFTANAVVNLTYGQSGSLLLYLHEQGLLRKFYDTYKARFQADKTGRLALEEVTGQSLPDLENNWKTWMLSRTPPPLSTGPNGAILGIKFAETTDGLRIDYVLPQGPAQQAGLRVGDIIVGLDDVEVRDSNSLVAILASHTPGESLILKIRRAQQYLERSLHLAPRPQSLPASRRGAR
ncbi:MAG TPA: PDZ domain-containing protein [Tepidisphaeraceae bacterium]|nr:PDZ domain-containing protein [Tepidisphaeraceae bacterium]